MRKFKIIIPEKCNSNAERYFNASSALFFLNQATFAWIEMDAINCNLFIFNDRKNGIEWRVNDIWKKKSNRILFTKKDKNTWIEDTRIEKRHEIIGI